MQERKSKERREKEMKNKRNNEGKEKGKTGAVTECRIRLNNEELHNVYALPNIIMVIKDHVAHMGKLTNA
jgi:hypothetical protein